MVEEIGLQFLPRHRFNLAGSFTGDTPVRADFAQRGLVFGQIPTLNDLALASVEGRQRRLDFLAQSFAHLRGEHHCLLVVAIGRQKVEV